MASVLLHHWPFNEASGTTYASVKTANTATEAGAVTPAQAGFGNLGTQLAIGASGKLSLATQVDLAGVFAISLWLEVDDIEDDDVAMFGLAATDSLVLKRDAEAFELEVNNGGAQTIAIDAAIRPTNGSPFHLVMRRNSSNVIEFFINNTLNSVTLTDADDFSLDYIHGTSTQAGMSNGGKLNDFRIYDSTAELSDDNVEALYEMGVLPTPVKLSDMRSRLVRGVSTDDEVFYFDENVSTPTGYQNDWDEDLTGGSTDQTASLDAVHAPYSGITSHRRVDREFANAAGYANMRESFTSPTGLDLTDGTGTDPNDRKVGTMEMYFPPGTLVDRTDRDSIDSDNAAPHLEAISLFIYDSSNLNAVGAMVYAVNQDKIEGYKSFPVVLGSTDFSAESNDATFADAGRFLIQNNWLDGSSKFLTFNKLAFGPNNGAARFFFRFDDGYDEHATRAASASANGINCTFAIATDKIGAGGHLTRAELTTMYSQGHALANHCTGISGDDTGDDTGWVYPDTDHYVYTSLAARVAGGRASQNDLQSWGFRDFARFWIVPGAFPNPGNKTSESDEQLVAQGYCDALMYGGAGNPGWHGTAPRSDRTGEHNWGLRAGHPMDKGAGTVQAMLDSLIGTSAGTPEEETDTGNSDMETLAAEGGDVVFYAHTEAQFPEASWAKVMTKALALQTAGLATIGELSDLVKPRPSGNYSGVQRGIKQDIKQTIKRQLTA
ncbi:MAG: hypothetical protein GY896_11715 [Gammaproteobacteria bacterium]|nr:hypothetical protein [Gammaproteobacteria bacterium]